VATPSESMFQANSPSGLTSEEARRRQRTEGYNELPQLNRRTPLRIIFEVLREPMLLLLLIGGLIYLLLGDLGEALTLLVFACLSVLITVVQEMRTERVLEALRDLTSPRAMVIRDGARRRIAGREVVRGDIVLLAEGDRVPADARVLDCHDLEADESLLTGESVPVRKTARIDPALPIPRPGGDALPFVYSGSLVVRGHGLAQVTAIGLESEIGRIGQSLSVLQTEPPKLQTQVRRLVAVFGMIGGGVSLLVVLLYGLLRGGWLDGILAGIAVGMSMLPEEFPVVLTVFMAMGAWRISRARVLTRRAAAIETLGSATVLCTDKTGTLTENRMSIARMVLPGGEAWDVATTAERPSGTSFAELLEFGVLASAQESVDPMERAFHDLGRSQLNDGARLQSPDWRLVHEYGLRPDLLAVSHVWQPGGARVDHIVAAKGAPEAIAVLCGLDAPAVHAIKVAADAMAVDGLRVLGVAHARADGEDWPETPRGFAFQFLGLVGLADALRASVPDAVRECRSAGIRVVMITGDYPATAQAIARRAGIDGDDLVTGEELERLSDAELAQRVKTATIFARIMPEQKLRIVIALKADGQIVAMTGDGVNDAPSLKAAHIGVAMGGRGTDVAREAASIVLLDDDFSSIIAAIRLGRRIYDNMLKATGFIFAVHVPIAGLALLPLALGFPIILGPMHIAFIEMIIDPVCSLVFEAETEEEGVMRRPPRAPDAQLFTSQRVFWGVLQGVVAFVTVAAIFLVAMSRGLPESEVRALTFFSLILSIINLIFVNRSFSASVMTAMRRPNRILLLVLMGVTAMLALILFWPVAGGLFHFDPPHWNYLLVSLGAGAAMLVVLEGIKKLLKRFLEG